MSAAMPHDPAQIRALAERIEGAERASRELDAEIALALVLTPYHEPNYSYGIGGYVTPDGKQITTYSDCWASGPVAHDPPRTEIEQIIRQWGQMPAYTASLDACRELHERALQGWVWSVCGDGGATVARTYDALDGSHGRAATPALAWVAAILRALAGLGEAGDADPT